MSTFVKLPTRVTALLLTMAPLVSFADPITTTFQQGINDYAGTVDMRLRNQDTLTGESRASLDVDGGDASLGDALYALVFMRFDQVFGTGPGQVPYGSQIVSARLNVTTNISGNAQSGNYFTISALQQPLLAPETGTIFAAYPNSAGYGGPDFQDFHTFRPGNAFRSVEAPIMTHNQGEKSWVDITETARHWAAGSELDDRNHGLVIADVNGTDGWAIAASGNATPEYRPALVISYYPPAVAVQREAKTVTLQQGAYDEATNTSYEDCVSVWIPDTVSPVNATNFPVLAARVPIDGSTLTGAQYLDGMNPAADSPDDQMIIQFKNIFGANPGQIAIRPTLRIERAVLRLTTAPSGSANSPGPVDVHRMLRPWYTEEGDGGKTFLPYTEFKAADAPDGAAGAGPTEANGFVAPLTDSFYGMWFNQVNEADVTDAVLAWAEGAPNLGLSVQQSTSDGWQIHFPGSTLQEARPQLIITYSYDPDADGDGLPDEWETANNTNPAAPDADADPDSDTLTNLQEYRLGTNPQAADTDGDGYADNAEDDTGVWVSPAKTGTSPVNRDSDSDGLPDGAENPSLPFTGPTQTGSDPNKIDTDGDGSPDNAEVLFAGNPVDANIQAVINFNAVLSDDFDGNKVSSVTSTLVSTGAFFPEILATDSPANGSVLRLVDSTANNNAGVAWDAVTAKANAVRLSFDYRLSADVGTAEAADGFGIGLFRTSAYGDPVEQNPGAAPRGWEDPRVGGGHPDALFFGFDIYSGAVDGNTLRVTGPDSTALLVNRVAPFPLNNGLFNRVVITLTSAGSGASIARLDVITDVNGAAPATVNLFNNVVIPGWDVNAEDFRVITGARTGSAVVTADMDNVSLSVSGAVEPPLPAFGLTAFSVNAETGAATLGWSSAVGGAYRVQFSENLSQWTNVGDPVTAAAAESSLTVSPPSANRVKLFFRVLRTE